MLSTLKEQYAGSKTIYAKNLSYSVEQADLYVLFFMWVPVGYYSVLFF